MWDSYVDYSCSAVGYVHAMWQAYLFRGYGNNVKCIYSSVPGHILILMNLYETYRHTCLVPAHELICICCICVAFEGLICSWHIYGNGVVHKSCISLFWGYSCTNWQYAYTLE